MVWSSGNHNQRRVPSYHFVSERDPWFTLPRRWVSLFCYNIFHAYPYGYRYGLDMVKSLESRTVMVSTNSFVGTNSASQEGISRLPCCCPAPLTSSASGLLSGPWVTSDAQDMVHPSKVHGLIHTVRWWWPVFPNPTDVMSKTRVMLVLSPTKPSIMNL